MKNIMFIELYPSDLDFQSVCDIITLWTFHDVANSFRNYILISDFCILSHSVKPGVRFREIGEVINRHATMSGLSVVICNFVSAIVEHFHFCEESLFQANSYSSLVKIGEIILRAWYWRAVSLCTKYSPLCQYPQ